MKCGFYEDHCQCNKNPKSSLKENIVKKILRFKRQLKPNLLYGSSLILKKLGNSFVSLGSWVRKGYSYLYHKALENQEFAHKRYEKNTSKNKITIKNGGDL